MPKRGDEAVTVWGLAAGRRSTKGAAYGAFTWHEYPNDKAAEEAIKRGDWKTIIRKG